MSRMPPVPPANQTTKSAQNEGPGLKEKNLVKHEHHPNEAEEGDTANIKQNTTNKGFYRGRREG